MIEATNLAGLCRLPIANGVIDNYFELKEAEGLTAVANGTVLLPPPAQPWTYADGTGWVFTGNSGTYIDQGFAEACCIYPRAFTGTVYWRIITNNQYGYLGQLLRVYASSDPDALTNGTAVTEIPVTTYRTFHNQTVDCPDDSTRTFVLFQFDVPAGQYAWIQGKSDPTSSGYFPMDNDGIHVSSAYAKWFTLFGSDPTDNITQLFATPEAQTYVTVKDEYADSFYHYMLANPLYQTWSKEYFRLTASKIGMHSTAGKSLYIAGDSLHAYAGGDGTTTGGFVTDFNQYLGFAICCNAGYAGSTWSDTSGGGGIKRVTDLVSANTPYDVIILSYGTNEDTGGNGTVDDAASNADGATMAAAMKWCVTQLRTAFPQTAIGIIIPPPKNTEDGMKVKGDLMVSVCELLHVPYVDMRQFLCIADMGSDGVHLGNGARKYGAAEAELITRICPYADAL